MGAKEAQISNKIIELPVVIGTKEAQISKYLLDYLWELEKRGANAV